MLIFDSITFKNKYGIDLLTPYIARWEYKDRLDGSLPVIECDGQAKAILTLFHIFNNIRVMWSNPIKITSGYRTLEHQKRLIKEGKKAAKYSPHTKGVALDILAGTTYDNEQLYHLITETYPWLRIGFHAYKQKFIHMDVAPLLPDDCIPDEKVILRGREYKLIDVWHEKGARW